MAAVVPPAAMVAVVAAAAVLAAVAVVAPDAPVVAAAVMGAIVLEVFVVPPEAVVPPAAVVLPVVGVVLPPHAARTDNSITAVVMPDNLRLSPIRFSLAVSRSTRCRSVPQAYSPVGFVRRCHENRCVTTDDMDAAHWLAAHLLPNKYYPIYQTDANI
ncbi:MAG: hypothetical protein NVS2B7_20670 [Herpetosiphon sp.]